jgi:transposase
MATIRFEFYPTVRRRSTSTNLVAVLAERTGALSNASQPVLCASSRPRVEDGGPVERAATRALREHGYKVARARLRSGAGSRPRVEDGGPVERAATRALREHGYEVARARLRSGASTPTKSRG